MNRRIVFWSLVICFATVHRAFPQNMEDLVDPSKTITDSLLNLISPTSSDSLKAAIYIEVARKAYDSDSALRYCHLALDLCSCPSQSCDRVEVLPETRDVLIYSVSSQGLPSL